MGTARPRTYDLRWSAPHLRALLVLCLLAAGALGLAWARSVRRGPQHLPPVLPHRLTAASERVNPNTAPPASLRRLPGIGAVRAADIVAWRTASPARPAFGRPEDLEAIRGIGPATVKGMEPWLDLPRRDEP